MRKWAIIGAVVAALSVTIAVLGARLSSVKEERDRYRNNVEVLSTDMDEYRVRDSLNAARVEALEFTAGEYRKYREQDAALIKDLKIRARDLERVNAVQTRTIMELSTAPKDTIIIRDSVAIPALSLTIRDKWFDFDGTLAGGRFTGQVVSRDSLVVVETVKMSRCIVKKWRRVKERRVDVVSKNPNTKIQGIEYVVIEK
jgi:hypothetical protein|nr:MAG TPA: hypothetical protein [Caudoviricetes sp.]